MRIAALALSTVLLSGCSWIGLGGHNNTSGSQYNNSGRYASAASHSGYQQSGQHYGAASQYGAASRSGPCEITSVSHPVPTGCSPEQVTIALPGGQYNNGYQQQAGQMPSAGSYGTSAQGAVRTSSLRTNADHQSWTRPRLRMTGSLGFENSVSGRLFNPAEELPGLYDPSIHFEGFTTGSQSSGQITQTEYFVPNPAGTPAATAAGTGFVYTEASDVSVSDAYSLPFTASIGAEYQLTPNISVFGNVAHSSSGGESAGTLRYEGDVTQYTQITDYEEITDAITGDVTGYTALPNAASYSSLNNVDLARTTVEVNDLQRSSAEIGGRYYFEDAFANYLERPVTPYIGASIGAAHYNALEAKQSLETLYLENYFNNGESSYQQDLLLLANPVEVLEKGWVPTGGLTIGAEWQVNPKASFALETGVKVEGGRNVTSGGQTNYNTSIPLTLRGSVGF